MDGKVDALSKDVDNRFNALNAKVDSNHATVLAMMSEMSKSISGLRDSISGLHDSIAGLREKASATSKARNGCGSRYWVARAFWGS